MVSDDDAPESTLLESPVIDTAPTPIEPVSDPIATARRQHGAAGAILAAGLFGVDIALGRKPKEEIPVVVDAAGEPTDIDRDGMRFPLDDDAYVVAPPMPPSPPPAPRPRRGRTAR